MGWTRSLQRRRTMCPESAWTQRDWPDPVVSWEGARREREVQPHVTDSDSVEEFAALLLSMKEQSGRTYEALAKRVGTSRSALHRYCSGQAVPAEFAVLERLGRMTGADRDTLLDLHRRWALAAAARRSAARQSAPQSARPARP